MAGPQNWRMRSDYALELGSRLSTILVSRWLLKMNRAAALALLAVVIVRRQRRRRKKRTIWCKDWILKRSSRGSYGQLFQELSLSDSDFFSYLRMPTNIFYYIHDKVTPFISREDTHLRESIPAGARLEATLIYLATGASYARLEFHTRISKASLCGIIPETCKAIYTVLKEEYMKVSDILNTCVFVSHYFQSWALNIFFCI